jgi:serine/threonine protein phosphatase PrpC
MHGARFQFSSGAATHVGKVRLRNEDRYLARPEIGLWAVADGMGGLDNGDIASQTVIDSLASIDIPNSASELFSSCETRVAGANSRLQAIARERNIQLGTTLAVLLAYDEHFACVWSGDSRIYRVRGDRIDQLSRDHTEVQDLVADGVLTQDEAMTWPGRNVITHAIGVNDRPELDVEHGALQSGDVFVICSDGLTAHVSDREILNGVAQLEAQQACDAMIALALDRGALDNVTVVVVRCDVAASMALRPASRPNNLSG